MLLDSITYQNKDVTMKSLVDIFKGKSFAAYGIDVPEIVDVRPTNLPSVAANELRLDNLFLLKDGLFAIVDYESEYTKEMFDKIEDDDTRQFVAKYLLTFTDKVINQENADKLRRILMLTKVEQIIENEKMEAVNKAIYETRKEERKYAQETIRKEIERVIENLLRKGNNISDISECTGFTVQEVQRIKDSIMKDV